MQTLVKRSNEESSSTEKQDVKKLGKYGIVYSSQHMSFTFNHILQQKILQMKLLKSAKQ